MVTLLSNWQLLGPEAATAGQPRSASLYGATKLNELKARFEAAWITQPPSPAVCGGAVSTRVGERKGMPSQV